MTTLQMQVTLQRPGFTLQLDLNLPCQGITAVFGPSGSGKTTALRVLAGLEPHARGRVRLGSTVWQDSDRGIFLPLNKRALGYVFQEASLFEHLDVHDNLKFGFDRTPVAERRYTWPQALSLLDLLGVGHLRSRQAHALSVGERQRVAMARALAASPQLLLMDEPLAALDGPRKIELLKLIDRFAAESGVPIIYITHAPVEVERLATRVLFMAAGRVECVETLHEALARPDSALFTEEGPVTVLHGQLGVQNNNDLTPFGNDHVQLWLAGNSVNNPSARLRVLARDVALSLHEQHGLSILNQLPITITSLHPDANGRVTVACQLADGNTLLAEITRYSCHKLALTPGMPAFALIKSVALLE